MVVRARKCIRCLVWWSFSKCMTWLTKKQ